MLMCAFGQLFLRGPAVTAAPSHLLLWSLFHILLPQLCKNPPVCVCVSSFTMLCSLESSYTPPCGTPANTPVSQWCTVPICTFECGREPTNISATVSPRLLSDCTESTGCLSHCESPLPAFNRLLLIGLNDSVQVNEGKRARYQTFS